MQFAKSRFVTNVVQQWRARWKGWYFSTDSFVLRPDTFEAFVLTHCTRTPPYCPVPTSCFLSFFKRIAKQRIRFS
eukprot:762658-Rhodomonas_salina.1